jgi:3-oxoacyl-[acyl-carrier protein] reductase
MNLELKDTIALVTGASSGIGAATAQILAQEGADVVAAYQHNSEGAQHTADQIRAAGRRAWLCRMDISDPASIEAALQSLPAAATAFDVVVLCAGQNVITPFAQLSAEEWERVIRVNLSSAFYLLQALTPRLRDGGSVVTVASVAAHTGAPHHAHYAAAKAGVINLTKSAARELAPRVRVNCVAPGITLTPMGQDTVATLAPDYAETKLLLRRYATPEEIARCIVFLASPVAGFITGATIDINGGRDLR